MAIIDKVAWIYIRDRRLLCVRSSGRALAYLPGGKREPGEGDEACLRREIAEELAVTLQPGALQWIAEYLAQADGKAEGLQVRLACYAGEFTGELRANAEIAEFMWLGTGDRDRCSPAAQRVLDDLHRQGLIV